MRGKHNPVGYIKVFKESMVHADRENRVQSGNTESGWENVLQTAIYPNQMIKMAQGYIVNY